MSRANKEKVTPVLKDTYLAMIQNSIGTQLFQNLIADVDGVKKDVMRGGDLSCAFFVSSILVLTGLIDRVHGTVEGTLKAMEQSGWEKTDQLKKGYIVVWEPKVDERGEPHLHIGFYVGDERAVSNSSKELTPIEHHLDFNGERKIEAIWKKKEIE